MKKIFLQVFVLGLVGAGFYYREPLLTRVMPLATPIVAPVKALVLGPEIKYPNDKKNLEGFSLVPGQWAIEQTVFVMVGVDQLAVYFEPDHSGRPIARLSVSERVRVVFKMPGWAFIAKPDLSEAIGWVQTDYLGFQYNFLKVEHWDHGNVGIKKEGYSAHYTIKPDGRFMMKWRAEGNGLILKGDSYGGVYQFKDVFWFKKAKPVYWKDFFFQDEQEFLYPEVLFNPKRYKALLID